MGKEFDEFIKSRMRLWMEIDWRHITIDSIISESPCFLFDVAILGTAAACTVTVYDGVDTGGRFVVQLGSVTGQSFLYSPKEPLYCRQGLFIDVDTNLEDCWVHFLPLRE